MKQRDERNEISEPINDGGPAFPFIVDDDQKEHLTVEWGMSLREYFAAKFAAALTVALFSEHGAKTLMAVSENAGISEGQAIAKMAFDFADAMLKAREK